MIQVSLFYSEHENIRSEGEDNQSNINLPFRLDSDVYIIRSFLDSPLVHNSSVAKVKLSHIYGGCYEKSWYFTYIFLVFVMQYCLCLFDLWCNTTLIVHFLLLLYANDSLRPMAVENRLELGYIFSTRFYHIHNTAPLHVYFKCTVYFTYQNGDGHTPIEEN